MRVVKWSLLAAAVVVTVSLDAAQPPQAPGAAAAPANPQLDQYKRNVGLEVDAMQENIQKWNDSVFSFGELGFQEIETTKFLTNILKQNGFAVQQGIAGIPTAWTARWGSGKPVIALGSDVDCIPQASQKPGVAYHDPIIEGAPGHGEGHNSGMPLQIAAALAVKKVMEQQHLQGTLMLWPGIAEELVGTKAYYVRAGIFKDVDISIFAHVGDNLGVSWGDGTQNGLVSVEYTFKGESAHAAGAPWRGRSALDAVELMDVGWNFRREHLRIQQRSHYVITNGGDQPNVVPPNASGWYYFRQTDYPHIKELWDIGDRMAKAATMMTDTEVSMKVLGSASAAARPRLHSGRGEARRRLGRHRRYLVERAHGDAALSLEYGGRSRPQLGERDLDGDADCAQRHPGRREGRRAHRHRFSDEARARDPGVGLFQECADEEHEIHSADSA